MRGRREGVEVDGAGAVVDGLKIGRLQNRLPGDQLHAAADQGRAVAVVNHRFDVARGGRHDAERILCGRAAEDARFAGAVGVDDVAQRLRRRASRNRLRLQQAVLERPRHRLRAEAVVDQQRLDARAERELRELIGQREGVDDCSHCVLT